jgi:RNA polymerase sigma-70 factor (ECF subfamily)
VLDGDRDAYAALVRRHETKVRGLCAALLSDRDEGEDAAQEVFVKAYRSLASFRGDASFSTWLHRIALNRCRDLLRARSRRKTESWDGILEKREGVEPEVTPVETGLDAADSADLARRLLAKLPEDYRTILLLREGEGLRYEEISRTLEVSLDAVKSRLRRARAALEEQWKILAGKEGGLSWTTTK